MEYIKTNRKFYLIKELSTVAILSGETGINVRSRVVEDHVQEADHAIILLQNTVEQTARP